MFIFKQQNSFNYVVISTQMVKLNLTENYWLTAKKKKCDLFVENAM